MAPSNLVLHRGAQAAGPEICDLPVQRLPSPWHVEVVVTARRDVDMMGMICTCAHAPWGHCKPKRWVVGCITAVRHTPHRFRVADLGPISAKIAQDKQTESWVAMERGGFTGDGGS